MDQHDPDYDGPPRCTCGYAMARTKTGWECLNCGAIQPDDTEDSE